MPRPTLLVFSLGAEADCRRRPVLPAKLGPLERELRQHCLDRLLAAGRREGFRLELALGADPEHTAHTGYRDDGVGRYAQRGATFGQRLVGALRGSRRRNPGAAIVLVAGDVPALGAKQLRRALDLAGRESDDVVIGPSPDGGFYLLAASRPVDEALDEVRWCGGNARQDLIDALRRQGRSVRLLEPLSDLDRPSDLGALFGGDGSRLLPDLLFGRILAGLRELTRPPCWDEIPIRAGGALVTPALRAPPV